MALSPEVDVASQGYTIEEALKNLKEAVDLYIEEIGLPEGISKEQMIITSIEIDNHDKVTSTVRQ